MCNTVDKTRYIFNYVYYKGLKQQK